MTALDRLVKKQGSDDPLAYRIGFPALVAGVPALAVYMLEPHDPSRGVHALVCVAAFTVILLGATVSNSRDRRKRVAYLKRAGKEGYVEEFNIVSSRIMKIEEDDDEGSDYFYEVGSQGTVMLKDIDLRASGIRNSNVTLVQIFGPDHVMLSQRIVGKGEPLVPVYVIPAAHTEFKDYPELTPIPGSLEDRLDEMQVPAVDRGRPVVSDRS